MSFIWLVVLIIPVYFVAIGIYNAYFHPLARVPGPKLYIFTQIPFNYHSIKGEWNNVLKQLHDQYGPIVRFDINRVSLTTADAFKTIYGHKNDADKTFHKDPSGYRAKKVASHIINANHEDHKRMRRLISHAFSDKALRNQEPVVQSYVDKLMGRLSEASDRNETVDLVRWYNFTTFDLIGDLAFGQSFQCLDSGNYHPWVRMIFENIKSFTYLMVARRLGFEGLAPYITPAHLAKSAREHAELTKETARKRIASKDTEREDFMSYILRHNDEKGMSEDEIIENSNILIIAGSETTATLLSGASFYLLKNPEKMEKVVQEVRSSFTSEADITIQSVSQLPYMIAVLQEAFRMYPPVPSILPRVCPKGGEYLEGYWLPENTMVGVPQWAAFQSARNFRNPSSFVPERWLDDPEYSGDQRAVVQPFSMGPRNCVGKNLAYAEMRLIFARLLWTYDIELMPESENWNDQKIFALWEKKELKVKLTNRVGLPEQTA
ncbi:unnamed protein product [Clonostachys chloroleuca]|uniref:Uncharacterized protein n=1 Tax=Clonostachys chloroleuca TaxID=1926264 RepID=A0AA35LQK9_9HYPO|nr:unnamed protein product [Clonostachys chloroleuca]